MQRIPLAQPHTKDSVSDYLDLLAARGYQGEVGNNYGDRVTYATDNSVYQVLPQCVLYPKDPNDLNLILEAAKSDTAFSQISFAPRGGGTGTNGQSLTSGIVVDVSRHLTSISDFDADKERVTVEPGVVLDQLNSFLGQEGYFFPPSVSTSSRATLGGMVGTDASGKGSRIYGKTSDWIESIKVVLWDGTDWDVQEVQGKELENLLSRRDMIGDICRQIHKSITENRTEIEKIFPKMNRGLTGYNLKQLMDDEGVMRLPYLIAGSEGTLCFTKSITLKVRKRPSQSAVVAVSYNDFKAALQHVPSLLKANPSAIEMIDDKIVLLAQSDQCWNDVCRVLGSSIGETQNIRGMHFVEFVGASAGEVQDQIGTLVKILEEDKRSSGAVIGWCVASEPDLIDAVWSLRKKCQGLLAGLQSDKRAIPFVEDTAVPPEVLADYVMELNELLENNGIDVGIFGHADVGCLHIRPMLDLKEQGDILKFRFISDRVKDLTKKYGGLMWGEHGKGYRGEYSPSTFGPKLFDELKKIKEAFDPFNKLNPGKLATPFSLANASLIKIDEVPFRADYDKAITPTLLEDYPKSVACNGNGACFTWDKYDPMCPSYKATRDRSQSPKGRSMLIKEWLRLQSDSKTKNTKFFADFTEEVYQSLETCLSCKACLESCPVQVNIPDMKAKFLEAYYASKSRPLKDRLLVNLEFFIPMAANLARFVNFFQSLPVVQTLIGKLFGFVDSPELSVKSVAEGLKERGASILGEQDLQELSQQDRMKTVVLIQDCFTSYYDADVVLGHYDLLTRLGYSVFVAAYKPNGKALHVKGFLDKFDRVATVNDAYLSRIDSYGVTLIGMEPSVTLMYRQEYRDRLKASGNYEVQLFSEWFANQLPIASNVNTENAENRFTMLQHCTERSNVPSSNQQWKQIFEAFGASVSVEKTGCCGMAGFFGHEASNQEMSKNLYEMSWQEHIDGNDPNLIVATGFSCRSQVKRFSGVRVRHPVIALASLIKCREYDGNKYSFSS